MGVFLWKEEIVMRNRIVSTIVKVGMFSTLSFVFFLISFPILPSYAFLKIQFSNLPAIIAGFALGPWWGMIVVIVRTLLNIIFLGTNTGFVGELADFLIGIGVVLSTAIIYKKHKTKKGGLVALAVGFGVWIVLAMLLNWLVLAPLYGLPKQTLPAYLFAGVLPFNAILAAMVSVLTFLVYKRISILLQKF